MKNHVSQRSTPVSLTSCCYLLFVFKKTWENRFLGLFFFFISLTYKRKQNMATITLKLKEVINPGPKETHVYETPDGRTISFTAGARDWTWHISTECPILHKHRERVIDAYINKGVRQHEYKGGWKEAISELNFFV